MESRNGRDYLAGTLGLVVVAQWSLVTVSQLSLPITAQWSLLVVTPWSPGEGDYLSGTLG